MVGCATGGETRSDDGGSHSNLASLRHGARKQHKKREKNKDKKFGWKLISYSLQFYFISYLCNRKTDREKMI